MVEKGNLRYWGLGIYGAIVGPAIFLDKVALTPESAIWLLGPIAAVVAGDWIKHLRDKKA